MAEDNTGINHEAASELRIGLAMSGAIALVLYETGVAHELMQFLRAWTHPDTSSHPSGYGAAFKAIPIRPVADILTGASAGGINTLLLGNCIANGVDFTRFHNPWIELADIAKLQYAAGVNPDSLLSSDPLIGPLGDALKANLAAKPSGEQGSPDLEAPELFVRLCRTHLRGHCLTTQDAVGHSIDELTKDDVIGFETEDFVALDNIDTLLRAGKATSAVPAAFAPVEDAGRYYVDGGLWDNQPIDLAVRAVADKVAFERTHRCIFFIDPQPTLRTQFPDGAESEPSLLSAVSSLPFLGVKGSIWPALSDILAYNQRSNLYQLLLREPVIGPIADQFGNSQHTASNAQIAPGAAAPGPPAYPTPTLLNQVRINELLLDNDPALIQRWNALLTRLGARADAPDQSAEAARTVQQAALDALATIGPFDLERRAVRRTLDSVNAKLVKADDTHKATLLEAQRTPSFAAAAVYAPLQVAKRVQRQPIAAQKAILYARLETLNGYLYCDGTRPDCRDPKDVAASYLRDTRHAASRFRLATVGFISGLEEKSKDKSLTPEALTADAKDDCQQWRDAIKARAAAGPPLFAGWLQNLDLSCNCLLPAIRLYHRRAQLEARRSPALIAENTGIYHPDELASARDFYLQNPVAVNDIDAAQHILAAMSDLSERRPIDLVRISPNDTDNLHLITNESLAAGETSATRKLAGEGLGHFGGFFEKRWRRNDYIWGRLDAAEIFLRALKTVGDREGYIFSEDDYQAHLVEIQTAILQNEATLYKSNDTTFALIAHQVGGVNPDPAHRSPQTQGANSRLIGFGRETLADLDEHELLANLNYLARVAVSLLHGGHTSLLSYLEQKALEVGVDIFAHLQLARMKQGKL